MQPPAASTVSGMSRAILETVADRLSMFSYLFMEGCLGCCIDDVGGLNIMEVIGATALATALATVEGLMVI